MELERKLRIRNEHGFTLVEGILVILIIGVLAVMVMPRIGPTDNRVVYITARQMTADMRYARTLAITKAKEYIVTFSTDADGTKYKIFPAGGEENPVKSMKIPKQVTYTEEDFGGTLSFTHLGKASHTGTDDENIISLAAGAAASHKWIISVIKTTGRIWAFKYEDE